MSHPPPSGYSHRLHWSGRTDRGKVRKNNEDSFLALRFDAQEVHYLGKVGDATTESADFVFAVSDGMGGAMAGEFASRITVEKITHLLPRSFKQSAMGMEAGNTEVLSELFEEIHGALTFVGASYEECAGMQATLSICWFAPGWMYFGHIGDSRIYYLPAKEKGLRQISHDDTYVGWLRRTGKISEMEARRHPQRTALQKALGGDNRFIDPQVGAVAYEKGDRFLLCTDGVIDGLSDDQLAEMIRTPSAADAKHNPAHRLVEASLERSGKDNTTALVIEVK
jgi:protein phosphatase